MISMGIQQFNIFWMFGDKKMKGDNGEILSIGLYHLIYRGTGAVWFIAEVSFSFRGEDHLLMMR